MHQDMIKLKINECYSKNKSFKSLIDKRYKGLDKSHIILMELNDFILSNNDIHRSNNLLKLIHESFLNLSNQRFTNFLRNLINNNPKRENTYSHMINDIKESLDLKYSIPSSYYNMNREQLGKECDKLLDDGKLLLLGQVRKFIKENFVIDDYRSFVYENRDQARRILRMSGEDETDKTYLRIRKMLGEHDGYLGVFTYFNKIEEIPFARIKNLFIKILRNKDILDRLDKNVVDYINKPRKKMPFKGADGRTYQTQFEKLEDDLTIIEEEQMAKRFADEYPGRIGKNLQKNSDFIEIIKILLDDDEKLELYRKFWIKKVSRYKTQKELLDSLMGFVFSNSTINKIRDQINNNSQIRLAYDDGEVIIVRVLSQEALQAIANDTSWCIKDSLSYWSDYVGEVNIQIVILNFSLSSTDLMRKVGLTIYYGGGFYTAHKINDSYISEQELNEYLKTFCTDLNLKELFDITTNLGTNKYYSQSEISNSSYRW